MPDLNFLDIAILLLALFISIIGHEVMHGLSALYYNDTSARDDGRLSINPIKHIDIFGSIIIPLAMLFAKMPFLFGWAKPINVNINMVIVSGGYKAAIVVALSGIFYNFCLLLTSFIILNTIDVDYLGEYLFTFLVYILIINVVLVIFNLIPIPPLDGSRALEYAFLHFKINYLSRFYRKIEKFGLFIIFIIMFIPRDFNIVFIVINYMLKELL